MSENLIEIYNNNKTEVNDKTIEIDHNNMKYSS